MLNHVHQNMRRDQITHIIESGTPVSDWSQHSFYEQARRQRGWSGTRTPSRFSNAGLAFVICIPLVLTGITLGQ